MFMLFEGGFINFEIGPFEILQLSTLSYEEKLALKSKLKAGLVHLRSATENIGDKRLVQVYQQFYKILLKSVSGLVNKLLTSENFQGSMSKKRRIAEACREQTDSGNHSAVEEIASAEKSEVTSTVTGVSKVRFLVNSQIAGGKVEKMDITKMRLCANILKKLMNHRYGWVFNQPVDPVKLNIPDYFSIISKPMDLGTVNKKLMSKLYVSTHQFAADVRLTFSNAMRYNPPGNDVHIMALELNNLFNLAWKSLECNWRKENPNLVKQAETNKRAIGRSNSFPKRSLTKSEKLKLRKDLAKIPVRKMPARLLNFLRKECMLEKIGERINVDIDMFDDEVLVELHQVLKSILDAGPAKVRNLDVLMLY